MMHPMLDDDARRLVDEDERVVFEQDVERRDNQRQIAAGSSGRSKNGGRGRGTIFIIAGSCKSLAPVAERRTACWSRGMSKNPDTATMRA
jgi:hypothetical protein